METEIPLNEENKVRTEKCMTMDVDDYPGVVPVMVTEVPRFPLSWSFLSATGVWQPPK